MPLIRHDDVQPTVHPTARVAPTAVLVGDVTIGPRTSVGFGAVLNAESGPVSVGSDCVVMDTAVLRGIAASPLRIGDRCLVGPRASLSGCTVEDEVFIATGASVFNGAHLGGGTEVRINAVVHIRSRLEPFSVVPIGWVAVGDPAQILPPGQHDDIWSTQRELDFPGYVFGADRPAEGQSILATVAPRYARSLVKRHLGDAQLD